MCAAMSYTYVPKGTDFDNLSDNWRDTLNEKLMGVADVSELKGWKVIILFILLTVCKLLRLKISNNIVITYRGSEPPEIEGNWWEIFFDWTNDASTLLLGVRFQVPVAKEFILTTMMKNKGNNFYVTGHSLGGHVTYNATAKGLNYKHKAIKGIVTFNGLGLVAGLVGEDLIDGIHLSTKLDVIRNYSVINNPVSQGPLSLPTEHFGTLYLYKKHENAPDEHSMFTFLKATQSFKRPSHK